MSDCVAGLYSQNMAAQKIQQFWRYIITRRKLRIRRRKITAFRDPKKKQRHLRERTTTGRLGELSMKRYKRVRGDLLLCSI